MTAPLRLLQVTDSHLLADPDARLLGVDTAATLAAVLDQALAAHVPDALLVTGDLAHHAEPGAYRRVRDIVDARYRGPVLYLAGNHDLGAPLHEALDVADSLHLDGWAVIAFDSHADGQTEARLDDGQRRALLQRIAAAPAPHVLLTCHHPPLPVGCPWLDKDRIPAGEELLEALAAVGESAAPRVHAMVCGHVHQVLEARHGSLSVLATPSTCFQFAPRTQRFDLDRDAMPGYRWLLLDDDGTVTSEVGRLEGGPLEIDMSEVS